MPQFPDITHHGAVDGVTGSCHEFHINSDNSVLIDCGVFQGGEQSRNGAKSTQQQIDFSIDTVRALLVTHVHIDHVGRIPYLLAAGFTGPIFCTEPSAILLPLVLEDAVKIGLGRNRKLIEAVLGKLKKQIRAVPYKTWQRVEINSDKLDIRFQRAGHILGSSYIECRTQSNGKKRITVFSGDLGAPHAPLLPNPQPPRKADTVVIESTYGNRNHEGRKERKDKLRKVIQHALKNGGVVMIPAFSIGRTQELLYELEDIIFKLRGKPVNKDLHWDKLPIIVDSPLAARFTNVYRKLRGFWDAEARAKVNSERHPLAFDQLITIDSHKEHLRLVNQLKSNNYPCIVLAASGMCAGGRIMNYLKALIENPVNDILFVGYQAKGTPGRDIQNYGPKGGYVELDDKRYSISARVTSLGGYSAHAGREDLIRFINRIPDLPQQVRIVHGDADAKASLQNALENIAIERNSQMEVIIP